MTLSPRPEPGRFIFSMTELRSDTRREIAVAIHAAAVAGVDPRAATRRAVESRLDDARQPLWIIALGKASHGMAEAEVDVLRKRGLEPEGGIIVAPNEGTPIHARLTHMVGDHPVPGAGSRAAAEAIGVLVERIAGTGTVFVLLSGGATSLVAAPVGGVADRDFIAMFE